LSNCCCGARYSFKAVAFVDVLPALHESREVREFYCFDLFAKGSERSPASDLDHSPGAPFNVLYLAAEFSANELPRPFPLAEPRLYPLE
jgi:hypothetical protein